MYIVEMKKIGTRRLCLKFYIFCYAALLKNFTYYAHIMLIDIEQFPDISVLDTVKAE